MEFKELVLEDRDILQSFTKMPNIWISDVNFSNLYMWRHSREIGFALYKENPAGQNLEKQTKQILVIQTRYPNQNPFIFYPLSHPSSYAWCRDSGCDENNAEGKNLADDDQDSIRQCIESLRRFYGSQNLRLEIHSLIPSQLESLKSWFDGEFEIVERRDRFDYIYNVESLITLSGRKFHSKKNHLNRFYLQYPDVEYESLSSVNIPELIEVNNAWFASSKRDDDGLRFENLGINDALKSFEFLGLKGGLLRIKGEIIAFSFGEVLDSQMALIHIEKANTAFSGAYQAINQALLKNEFSSMTYANREEDLGIEGLRKAKLSYQPEFLLEKYDVRFRE